ncbi:Holliday junction resolvase RuvX [Oceanotoga sp. DSM 15011]|uniref:Putative pre-16S rRNA nuclease n=1 Tax=Oceanotoga teriensis TaxID=515440 RepID=A0AA45HJM9_9BACT|nr:MULTISPECIES: RuvX/YqgF family protein [Oceanotoga]MDO7975591.1 Holliday junction resolvase RuvX [Oceanotoga teriensis]PWJ96120.1 putative Holliday junction resolvase [Oceanotoga teriensis]UYO99903.1 Holliday junction resolvase RuvX [Oceanotoga sp. DSM 15011]
MKIYGIDHGDKRCGISSANEILRISVPKDTVEKENLLNYLQNEKINSSDTLVFGMPLSMSGRYSTQTYNVINEALKIKDILKCKVFLVDERLTSKILFNQVKGKVNSKKVKNKKDQNSSSLILSTYLSNPNSGIELINKEVYKIELKDQNILIYDIAIENLSTECDLFINDPWIFWYYFNKGFKSTNKLEDIKVEYNTIVKNSNIELLNELKAKSIINL